jgi:ribosome-binding protein aMBF1 (putative translation factor)
VTAFKRKLDYAEIDRLLAAGMSRAEIGLAIGAPKESVASYIRRKREFVTSQQHRAANFAKMLMNKSGWKALPAPMREAIQRCSRDRPMSIMELSRRSGYAESTVRAILNGRRRMSFGCAVNLIEALGFELTLEEVHEKDRVRDRVSARDDAFTRSA